MLHLSPTASPTFQGVAEWIRSAAGRVNALIGLSEEQGQGLSQAQAAITALQSDKLEWVAAPVNANDPGTPGQAAYDSGYLYICIATDTWIRFGGATWP